MRSFLNTTWRDLRDLPSNFIRSREALAVSALIMLPWVVLLIRQRDLSALQPLTWIFGFLIFFWLIGHRRLPGTGECRRPRLELGIALALAAVWIAYRVGEYWHWYVVPTLGLGDSCGPISETPLPKMIEMFLVPFIFLLAAGYSLRQMGFGGDRASWLAGLVPVAILAVLGLTNLKPQSFAVSSACFFFGAGLPEEFLYRAFLQTRLEALLHRPLWSVWLASFVFGLSHIPIDLAGNLANWQHALLTAFTYQATVGFAFGYAYLRTRNLVPLSLVHTLIDFVL